MSFNKVLVANRGEIALRVMRACKELGIPTATVYSEADDRSLHTRLADEAYPIGPPEPSESYLNMEKILDVCQEAGCDALHPGYGFLAEDPHFAEMCEDRNIVFIGPDSGSLRTLGAKIPARKIASEVGIPVIPGSLEPVHTARNAQRLAEELGYPVLVKASGGGGGKGMRLVRGEDEIEKAISLAVEEASISFGNSEVYLEKVIPSPRHIEVQTLTDSFGNVRHFFERECSIQRRHQKILEESPSPTVRRETRDQLLLYALILIESSGYRNVGTVEFLVDLGGNPYFLEVNSRIQVEHPVTEAVTGIDLVKEQILASAGEVVSKRQEEIHTSGHAIECRIYAEDPFNEFSPSPGRILTHLAPSGDVRVETEAYDGWVVSPYYDTLISKVITWGRDRMEAIAKMRVALDDYRITGIRTTIPLHRRMMDNEDFLEGRIDTAFLERNGDELLHRELSQLYLLASAALREHIQTPRGRPATQPKLPVGRWRAKGREELHFSASRSRRGWR